MFAHSECQLVTCSSCYDDLGRYLPYVRVVSATLLFIAPDPPEHPAPPDLSHRTLAITGRSIPYI